MLVLQSTKNELVFGVAENSQIAMVSMMKADDSVITCLHQGIETDSSLARFAWRSHQDFDHRHGLSCCC